MNGSETCDRKLTDRKRTDRKLTHRKLTDRKRTDRKCTDRKLTHRKLTHRKRSRAVCCLAVTAALCLTGCSGAGTSGQGLKAEGNTAAAVSSDREWVYVPEVITVGEKSADYERMQPVGDSLLYVSLQEESGGEKNICRYSLADGELEDVPIRWTEGGDDWDVGYRFFAQDQSLYMTANVYPADFGSMKRFLCRFDSEGNCLFSGDITEQAGRDVSLRALTVDSKGRIYIGLDTGEILLYTDEGKYCGAVNCSASEDQEPAQIKDICEGSDGNVYVCVSKAVVDIAGEAAEGAADRGGRSLLMKIDFENVRLSEIGGELPYINGLCAGAPHGVSSARQGQAAGADRGEWSDRYDLLLYDDRAVYGYRIDAQEKDSGSAGEELFAWMDSDINGYYVANLFWMEDGRLCAAVSDWLNDDRVIVALKRTKAAEAPARETLVLATVTGGSDLAAMAVKFNRGNSRYHLTVKTYESLTDLYNAILAREPVDLIDLSGLNVERLAKKGFFEDLTPYLERSQRLAPSDFVDGILSAYTIDDTLVGIPQEFMIRTVVGDGARLNNKAGLTLEELLELGNRYPEAKTFDGMTRDEVMQYLMMFNEDTFIDWNTGACHFDSERFQEVLEYVSRFPDEPAGETREEPLADMVRKGEVLFAVTDLYPRLIRQDTVQTFGEDAACVGFPTADGKGGHLLFSSDAFAIAAVSRQKESAWCFLEEALMQKRDHEIYADFHISYPSLKATLEERAEAAIEQGDLTWDEVNVALRLLPDAKPFFSLEDDAVIKIINEEAPAYYSGQKGPEEVAGIIQNRVRIYVSENLGL